MALKNKFHLHADKHEPRLARSFLRAVQAARASMPEHLEALLIMGDVEGALALVPDLDLTEATARLARLARRGSKEGR